MVISEQVQKQIYLANAALLGRLITGKNAIRFTKIEALEDPTPQGNTVATVLIDTWAGKVVIEDTPETTRYVERKIVYRRLDLSEILAVNKVPKDAQGNYILDVIDLTTFNTALGTKIYPGELEITTAGKLVTFEAGKDIQQHFGYTGKVTFVATSANPLA